MISKNLAELSETEFLNLFNSVENIFCDNDGVLSIFGKLIVGVKECISKLRMLNKNVKIVSNNTAFGRDLMCTIFNKQGIPAKREDIITPTCAIISYLNSIKFDGKVWIMGFEPMVEQIREARFSIAESENRVNIPIAEAQSYYFDLDPTIKAIIVDISFNMTMGNIAKTIKYLESNPEMILLFGCSDSAIPFGPNDMVIGPSHFQNIITTVTKHEPIALGKPSKDFGKYLIESLHCDPARTLFIGDNLDQDIGFAKQLGFKQLVVLTGKTQIDELDKCDDTVRPMYYVSGMEELNVLLNKYYS